MENSNFLEEENKLKVEIEVIKTKLDSIDESLKKFEEIPTILKLNEKEMEIINREIKFLKEEQQHLKEAYKTLEGKITSLETKDLKQSASKWNFITDSLFKYIVGGLITFLGISFFSNLAH